MTGSARSVDTAWMQRAIALAHQGRFWAKPNPHVGCVLVRDDAVVGEGFTQPAGQAHAEIMALQDAGDARGATAYVTLEPCSHYGKTGPCADALVAAGISRVVVALEDPNPQVAGAGIARLQAAGVAVDVGIEADAVQQQLAGFLLRMQRGYGRIRAKLAMSLDGRTAMASGESQWITGADARRDVQLLRAESGVILTGVGTVLADDCSLTAREADLPLSGEEKTRALHRPPTRVVMDARLQTPASAKVLAGDTPTYLLYHRDTPVPQALKNSAAHLEPLGADVHGRLSFSDLLATLSDLQANEILVESGPTLAGAMIQAGLLDELLIYMAPTLMGSTARPLLNLPIAQMSDKRDVHILSVEPIGQDWRLRCKVH